MQGCKSRNLTLARIQCFVTFARTGEGAGAPPPPCRFQTKRHRASKKRPADCSRRVIAISGIIFGPRSIFDLVMAGQSQIFGNLVTRPAGGGGKGSPLRSPKLLDRFPNFKRHSIALYVNYPYKVKNLTRSSLMTSQVRSKSEFSTFRAWWHRRVKFRC